MVKETVEAEIKPSWTRYRERGELRAAHEMSDGKWTAKGLLGKGFLPSIRDVILRKGKDM